MKVKRTYECRQFTNLLHEYIDEGIISKDMIINCFTSYMSEDDVRDMLEYNEIIEIIK